MTIDVAPTKRQGFLALSPIFVFLAFYLGVSIAVGDFYKVPVSVAFILAVTWAVVTTHGINLSKRIEIFSRGAANANVLYMSLGYRANMSRNVFLDLSMEKTFADYNGWTAAGKVNFYF